MVDSPSVARIESIRPAATFDSSLAQQPLAELLIGILRGNLTGRLDVDAQGGPSGSIYFRHGVPVAVDFSDASSMPSTRFSSREQGARANILRLFDLHDAPI